MEMWIGIGLLLLGGLLVVANLHRILGFDREWARATPSIFNYLARNFTPYTYLGFGLILVGPSPQLLFTDPPELVGANGGILMLLGRIFLASMSRLKSGLPRVLS